jgi:hypothetical protein
VQLQAFFDTIGTATAYGANSQTAALVDGVASVPFPLVPAAVNPFQIDSLQDGVYYVNLTRLPADVRGVNLTAWDGNNIPTPVFLAPPFTDGVYVYTVTVPCESRLLLRVRLRVCVRVRASRLQRSLSVCHSRRVLSLFAQSAQPT